MTIPTRVSVVVPTVGNSPVFERCLEALSTAAEVSARVVVVAGSQVETARLPDQLIDRLIVAPAGSGFAVACNLGLAEITTPYAAIVNDDAIVEPDWLAILLAQLDDHPQVAAAQGLNLQLNDADKIDGCGIAWNRRWQPMQIDHGLIEPSSSQIVEVFGASATAVVYRTDALNGATVEAGKIFDPKLHTYYDDVDLAVRLRARQLTALFVPQARAFHAGGASTATANEWRLRQLYGNRLLVLARLLGRSFWVRLPLILRADIGDFGRTILEQQSVRRRGILSGWRRAGGLLPWFTHSGPPMVSIEELRRYRIDLPGRTRET